MSNINPEKVWHLTQQEISGLTGLSQSYVHYLLNFDRKPSIETAEKLEEATGVCREAWLWPDRHHNPYIPFYEGNNCLTCFNRKDRTRWMVERMIKLTSAADPGARLKTFFSVVNEARIGMGFPDSLKFIVLTIKPDGFVCLHAAGKPVLPPPYLMPYWLVPWMSEELLKGNVVEITDTYDERLARSPMDAQWIAERKCEALLAVPSERLLLITTTHSGGPTFEWTDETVESMKWLVKKLDNLLGDELDNPLSRLPERREPPIWL